MQIRKLQHREVKLPEQSHTASAAELGFKLYPFACHDKYSFLLPCMFPLARQLQGGVGGDGW